MQVVNKLKMLLMVVSDMPKAKAFYADTLGLEITQDFRQTDDRWWVSLAFPDGGASINLTTYRENVTPGTISLYFVTSDVAAAHRELSAKGAKVSEVQDNLYGPGSGVKWFNLHDPDGNQVLVVEA
jgi:catechol 2,3-dioxygenase-like lactoylglutathione lyase family enzyme